MKLDENIREVNLLKQENNKLSQYVQILVTEIPNIMNQIFSEFDSIKKMIAFNKDKMA